MEAVVPGPKLRIVSGPHQVVERQLNELLNDYAVTVWNFAVVDGAVHVTAILLALAELRKQQLGAIQQPQMMRRN